MIPLLKRIWKALVAAVVLLLCIKLYLVGDSPKAMMADDDRRDEYSGERSLIMNSTYKPNIDSIVPLNIGGSKSYVDIFGSNDAIQKFTFSFLINPSHLCQRDRVLAVIYVHSAAENAMQRRRIRRTWASVKSVNGSILVIVFILGQTDNELIQTKINEESSLYEDIVQVNFIDSYKNLTYKNLMGLNWVANYCRKSSFIVKVDDDTFVNPYHLVNFLQDPVRQWSTQKDYIYCSVMKHIGVPKNNEDKWHFPSEDYPYKYYPPYCEGYGYILTHVTARKLLAVSEYVPYFWIDDVYVTGFLTFRLGIELTQFEPDHSIGFLEPPNSYNLTNYVFLLAVNSIYAKNWNVTWDTIRDANRLSL